MSRSILKRAILVAAVTTFAAGYAEAQEYQAALKGLQEVPSVRSQGHGTLKLIVHPRLQSVNYTLNYSSLTANALTSHIHFAKAFENGGVIAFLCGSAGTFECPASTTGTITGMLTPASVIGPPAQGVAAGDFAGLLEALSTGSAYVDIHTANFPAGEIRGQIQPVQP